VTGWLLDTNVLSELRRPRPEPKVVAFVASQPLDLLYVSIVTLAEIRFGIELVPDPARRSQLTDWLNHNVRQMFEQRALMVEEGRKSGHTFSQPDLIIAATGQRHGLTIVSRDTTEYTKAHVPVFNPWIDSLPNAGG
jgi:predicted nucleic acid-binding protein